MKASINEYSAFFAGVITRLLVDRSFFQTHDLPKDLVVLMAQKVIQIVQNPQSPSFSVAKELSITWKEIRGIELTDEEKAYQKADTEINVIQEIANGFSYSSYALIGFDLFGATKTALANKLYHHLPAVLGLTAAKLLAPNMIGAAVVSILKKSSLSKDQQQALRPWLFAIGNLAAGFVPKVSGDKDELTYQFPSMAGHLKKFRTNEEISVHGHHANISRQGTFHTPEGDFDAVHQSHFVLGQLNNFGNESVEITLIKDSGTQIPVIFHHRRDQLHSPITVECEDPEIARHWQSYFGNANLPSYLSTVKDHIVSASQGISQGLQYFDKALMFPAANAASSQPNNNHSVTFFSGKISSSSTSNAESTGIVVVHENTLNEDPSYSENDLHTEVNKLEIVWTPDHESYTEVPLSRVDAVTDKLDKLPKTTDTYKLASRYAIKLKLFMVYRRIHANGGKMVANAYLAGPRAIELQRDLSSNPPFRELLMNGACIGSLFMGYAQQTKYTYALKSPITIQFSTDQPLTNEEINQFFVVYMYKKAIETELAIVKQYSKPSAQNKEYWEFLENEQKELEGITKTLNTVKDRVKNQLRQGLIKASVQRLGEYAHIARHLECIIDAQKPNQATFPELSNLKNALCKNLNTIRGLVTKINHQEYLPDVSPNDVAKDLKSIEDGYSELPLQATQYQEELRKLVNQGNGEQFINSQVGLRNLIDLHSELNQFLEEVHPSYEKLAKWWVPGKFKQQKSDDKYKLFREIKQRFWENIKLNMMAIFRIVDNNPSIMPSEDSSDDSPKI